MGFNRQRCMPHFGVRFDGLRVLTRRSRRCTRAGTVRCGLSRTGHPSGARRSRQELATLSRRFCRVSRQSGPERGYRARRIRSQHVRRTPTSTPPYSLSTPRSIISRTSSRETNSASPDRRSCSLAAICFHPSRENSGCLMASRAA